LKICPAGFQSWERIKVGRFYLIHSLIPKSMSSKVKTGGIAKVSGQYRPAGTRHEITLSRGDRVPPYSGEAKTFKLVDKTKHKS